MKNEKIFKIVFIAASVLLIAGGAAALVRGAIGPVTGSLMGIGVLGAVMYVIINRKELAATVTSGRARRGLNAVIYTLLAAAIIVLVQVIATINTKQLDLTKTKRHSLSEQTEKLLKNLDKEIEAVVFYSMKTRGQTGRAEDMLARYAKLSPKFTFQAVDADKNPSYARQFGVDKYNVAAFKRKDNGAIEKVDALSEEAFTNALIRLSKESKKKIYVTKGHGEGSLDAPGNDGKGLGIIRDSLASYHYDVQAVELFASQGVPSDCAILIVAGPQNDIYPQEAAMMKDYLKRGGKIAVLKRALTNTPVLDSFTAAYGIRARQDVVVDNMGRMFGGDVLMPIISQFENHMITRGFGGSAFMPLTRSLETAAAGTPGLNTQALAKSGQGSWGEKDLNGVRTGTVKFDKGTDNEAPLIVAAISEIDFSLFKETEGSAALNAKAVLAVFGSADFITNAYAGAAGNRDFFMNAVSYLGNEGDLIAIRPKDRSFEPLFLSKTQGRMTFIVPVVFMPLLALAIGILVFIKRRRS